MPDGQWLVPPGGNWLAPLVVAPFVGSFLGVLVSRLPDGRPVVLARSACPACNTRLGALELVPLASYLALRGRCRHCRAPIGWFHPAIELTALLVAILVVCLSDGGTRVVWSGCILGWGMLALAWIDWRSFRLPDALTLPLLLLGLLACAELQPDALGDHAAAAVIGYLAFRLLSLLYRRLRRREGLGAGDAKLLAASGAWLGLAALPSVILVAAVATLAAAILSGRGRLRADAAVPFGPGLAVATWGLWLWQAANGGGS